MVSTEDFRSRYEGDDSNDQFEYGFYVTDKTHLRVVKTGTDGVDLADLVVDVDYSVGGVGDEDNTTWIVTYPLSGDPLAPDEFLTIIPNYPFLQETPFRTQGTFFPKTHENALDYLTRLCQMLKEQVDRAVKISVGSADDPDDIIASLEESEANAEAAAAAAALSAAEAAASASGTLAFPLWLTGTLYTADVSKVRFTDEKLYRCPTGQTHTSGTFATDLAAGKWIEMSASNPYSKGADIASATTTDIGAATGDFVDITGTTTITGFGTVSSGIERTLRFTGILTLTHNATSLILPGGASITTANGDTAIFRSLGSGNWKCISYQKASGAAVVASSSGKLAQAVSGSDNTPTSTTSSIPDDNTTPQNTEGTEIVTASITPTNASSTLEIEYGVTFAADTAGKAYAAMFVDSTADAIDSMGLSNSGSSYVAQATKSFTVSAGSTSARTYKLRVGINSGTIYINQRDAGARHNGLLDTYIRVREILP